MSTPKCYVCGEIITGYAIICDNDCGVIFCSDKCMNKDKHICGNFSDFDENEEMFSTMENIKKN